MPELDATEIEGIGHELRTSSQLQFTPETLFQLAPLHLCGILQLFHPCLSREALLINAVDGITDIKEVLRHQQHIVGHKRQERHFFLSTCHQFWHNLHLLTLVLGKLVLHFERPD